MIGHVTDRSAPHGLNRRELSRANARQASMSPSTSGAYPVDRGEGMALMGAARDTPTGCGATSATRAGFNAILAAGFGRLGGVSGRQPSASVPAPLPEAALWPSAR